MIVTEMKGRVSQMKRYGFSWVAFVVLLTVISGFGRLPGAQKPNFSGVWKFDPDKSSLQIPPPTSSIFQIEHQEPSFNMVRTHIYSEKSDTWSIHLTTDGKEFVQEENGEKLVGRLYWEDDTLVFDSKIYTRTREASNIVRYELSEDGKTLTAIERFRGPAVKYDNIWVFEKD
jgi:hypothetical protein